MPYIIVKVVDIGIHLLDDAHGLLIIAKPRDKYETMILRILQKWLEGKGRAVSWKTLVKTLRLIEKYQLADQIENKITGIS